MVNLAGVKQVNPVHWGIAVRRSSLRLFPQQQGIFEKPDETDCRLLLSIPERLSPFCRAAPMENGCLCSAKITVDGHERQILQKQTMKLMVTDIKNTVLHNGGSYLSHIHSIKEWAY